MVWWKTAKVGDRVVAVDGTIGNTGFSLTVGKVYKITAIPPPDDRNWNGCFVYFRITDDPNPSPDSAWAATCFRPAKPLTARMDELCGLLDPEMGPWGKRERQEA